MPTSATIDRDRDGGFTLVELMLALAVIGLVAALALPGVRAGNGPAGLRAKAYEAAALLRADRAAAQLTGRTVETILDVDARALRSGASGGAVDLSGGFSARAAGVGGRGFRFHPDGRSSGGTLALASGRTRLDLTVDGFTSAVEIRAAPGDAR